MTRGTFIAVVGPSGAGKDSVMRGVAAELPDVTIARRVITRPPDPSEDFLSVDPAAFEAMKAEGAFALDWQAHGLAYGIPASVSETLVAGGSVFANLSRAAVPAAITRFDPFMTLLITASRATLAARLAARGRETKEDIARRLERASFALPDVFPVTIIHNDGTLQQAVDQALAALAHPVRS